MRFRLVWSTLAAVCVACSALSAREWHAVEIGYSTLGAGRLVELLKVSREFCIATATLSTWAELFCHEGDRCVISDVRVGGSHDDSPFGSVIPCWTKNACVFHGIGYEEGDVFADKCLPMKCQNHKTVVQLPGVSSSCNDTFTVVPGVGCVYLHPERMTWCDPRSVCRDYGGQLVLPAEFHAFSQRLSRDDVVWIGVRGREWTDRKEEEDVIDDDYDFENNQIAKSSLDGPFELICEIKI
ncbi:uncharacterized protein LOC122246935 [Penaeus japonicus]|uniref:uncharacterized protein LOC122246935 n=1 Tax=Penaeus japonicus TaxID=27405 RepID=UPI001C70BF09|nr:uncharacterized protein LOC122246935 [Penaeus japonicus]